MLQTWLLESDTKEDKESAAKTVVVAKINAKQEERERGGERERQKDRGEGWDENNIRKA